jgi:hypothetical protein
MQDFASVPWLSPDQFAHRNLRILMAFVVCVDKALKKGSYVYTKVCMCGVCLTLQHCRTGFVCL